MANPIAGRAAIVLEVVNRMRAGMQQARAQLASFGLAAARAGAMLTGVGVAGGVGIARIIKLYADFDDQIRAANARLPIAGQNFKLLKDTAKELGQTTSWTATQAAEMMATMAKMGFGSAENIAKNAKSMLDLARATGVSAEQAALMAKRIAQASGMGDRLGEVADILASAANQSSQSFEELANAMEYAAAIAKTTGMELSETASFMMVLANNGIVASKAGVALRAIFTRLVQNQKQLKDEFGIDIDGLNRIKQLPEIFGRLNKALEDKTPAERLAILNDIFGKIGLTASAIGLESADDLNKMMLKMSSVAGESARIAEEMDKGLGGALRLLKSAFESFFLTLGDQITPMIRSFAESLREGVKWLEGMLRTVEFIMPALVVLVGVIFSAGVALLAMGFAAIAASVAVGILAGVTSLWAAATTIATGGLNTIIPLLLALLPILTAAGWTMFGVFILDLDEGFGSFMKSLRDGWAVITETTKRFAEMMRVFGDKKQFVLMAGTIRSYLGSVLEEINKQMGSWGKPFLEAVRVMMKALAQFGLALELWFLTWKKVGDNLLALLYTIAGTLAVIAGDPGSAGQWYAKAAVQAQKSLDFTNKLVAATAKWADRMKKVDQFFADIYSGKHSKDFEMLFQLSFIQDFFTKKLPDAAKNWYTGWAKNFWKAPGDDAGTPTPTPEDILKHHQKYDLAKIRSTLGLDQAARDVGTIGSFHAASAAASFKSQSSMQREQLHEQKEANKKLDSIIQQIEDFNAGNFMGPVYTG